MPFLVRMKVMSGFNTNYIILNNGQVWSVRNKIKLKTRVDKHGYEVLILRDTDRKKHNLFIHRLVAKYFIENPDNYDQINHIDGDKLNNRVTNLEWCNHLYNQRHRATILRKAKSNELYVHYKTYNRKWYVLLPTGTKRLFIGYFNTEQEAIDAKHQASDPLVINEINN